MIGATWLFLLAARAEGPPRPPPVAEPPAPVQAPPGSLWDEGQARVIIGMDGNARRLGDLITVQISEETATELNANTTTSKQSDTSAGIGSFLGLVKGVADVNPNLGGGLEVGATSASAYTGDGNTKRAGKLAGELTCEVIEVLPNGNLRIWGYKEVRANRESQYLVLTGTVRPRDIQADNTVKSYLLAQAQIEFSGAGPVGDKQGPGIGQRVLDHAWPF